MGIVLALTSLGLSAYTVWNDPARRAAADQQSATERALREGYAADSLAAATAANVRNGCWASAQYQLGKRIRAVPESAPPMWSRTTASWTWVSAVDVKNASGTSRRVGFHCTMTGPKLDGSEVAAVLDRPSGTAP
ncbi:hypothetical protein [Deinococcus aquiradiocola]|uniref:Uncharacterized protein n=1 Tax=Deinococcus aquiradiocola TaxID=393059 RepID=A0A917ULX8_9DEIO|nr:hypothetical protein [Deinococcus aquiradiocola]GGJ67045.1 hypothetical protein GCM10008939_09050 [Deinococcus aquiradiocola]